MSYYDKFGDFGEKTAAIDARGEQVSYAELAAFAKEVGKRVPARSLVFSFCRNEIGSMAGYLAFLNNRIVPLMLDAKINEVLLTNLMDIYQPQYVCRKIWQQIMLPWRKYMKLMDISYFGQALQPFIR